MWKPRRIAGSMMVLALAVGGCGSGSSAVRMASSDDVPAAQGTVKASRTDDGNTAVEIEVDHLAPPDRVGSGATTYVVWAAAPGGEPQNLGALRIDGDLHGSLKTVTPLTSFEVFVTAESSPTALSPTNRQVLSARVE